MKLSISQNQYDEDRGIHNPTTFEEELGNAIRAMVRQLKKDGICGMGMRNLLMVVKPPSHHLPGAPNGTNARYYYKQMFERVANKSAKGFVYPQP